MLQSNVIEPLAVDVRGVAQLLACSCRHVERMATSGKMPAPLRIGRAKRWNIEELRAWLAAGAPDRREWEARKNAASAAR